MKKILHGDCFKLLPELDVKADMIVCDEPYVKGFKYGDPPNPIELGKVINKVLAPHGTVWMFGDLKRALEIRDAFKIFDIEPLYDIIWGKEKNAQPPVTANGRAFKPLKAHTLIWVYKRSLVGRVKKVAIKELHLDIKRLAINPSGSGKHKHKNGDFDTRSSNKAFKTGVGYPISLHNVGSISTDSNEYIGHPTQTPLALMKTFISIGSGDGDLIIDPYGGSGTSAVACEILKRNYVICELDKGWFDAINKRVNACRETLKFSGEKL